MYKPLRYSYSIITILFLTTFIPSNLAAQNNLLLTGNIKAGDTQKFTVPWSQTWRRQIKWMKQEGEITEKGDLVVMFDTATLDSEIEQQHSLLRQSKEKAKNSKLKLEKEIINAEHALIKAELEFELAKASVEIPKTYRSDFEEDNLEFDFKKAKNNLVLAKSKLTISKETLSADIKKQAIAVQKIQSELTRKEQQIAQLQLRASRGGPVLHATHPWNGSKISEGQSVQTSWVVATIPGSGSEYIQTWVNEVDWPKIEIGQTAILTLDAFANQSFSGKVTKVGQQAESKTEWGGATYYDVKIEIVKNSTNPLIPGMSVRIELEPSDALNLSPQTVKGAK